MITRRSAGFAAGIVALALFVAACSGTSSPEVVEPAASVAAPVVSDPDAGEEPSGDVTYEQIPDATAPAAEAEATDDATDEAADPADPADPAEVVDDSQPAIPAPETLQFTAPLVGGGEIDLAANFNNKPTLFWFWAPN